MIIDDGCHYGEIAYIAEADPDKVGIYHCTECRTLSGTAFHVSVGTAHRHDVPRPKVARTVSIGARVGE